jgi:hypothetical protein
MSFALLESDFIFLSTLKMKSAELCGSLYSPVQYCGQRPELTVCANLVQFLNEDAPSVVLMEDTEKSNFVAVGEYSSSDYTPERYDSSFSTKDRVIRVILKACTHPKALLSFPVVDSGGNIVCRTLGEAFQQKIPVWWMEGDAVATCVDRATHTP